ncbi:MAG: ABC transporter permease [Desulfuromonadaceae bacterium]
MSTTEIDQSGCADSSVMPVKSRVRFGALLVFKLKSLAVVLAALFMLLLLWEAAVRSGMTRQAPIPPASKAVARLVAMAFSGELWAHTAASLQRIAIGYSLAISLAIPLGLLMGWYKTVDSYLDPMLQTLRQVPLLAVFPVFILFMGIDELPKLAMLTLTAFWWVLLGTTAAVKAIDPQLVIQARSLAITPFGMFHKVILPAIVPSLIVSLRLAYTEMVLIMIAVESQNAMFGFGRLGGLAGYAGILTMTAIGLVVNYAMQALEEWLCRWKEPIASQ